MIIQSPLFSDQPGAIVPGCSRLRFIGTSVQQWTAGGFLNLVQDGLLSSQSRQFWWSGSAFELVAAMQPYISQGLRLSRCRLSLLSPDLGLNSKLLKVPSARRDMCWQTMTKSMHLCKSFLMFLESIMCLAHSLHKKQKCRCNPEMSKFWANMLFPIACSPEKSSAGGCLAMTLSPKTG